MTRTCCAAGALWFGARLLVEPRRDPPQAEGRGGQVEADDDKEGPRRRKDPTLDAADFSSRHIVYSLYDICRHSLTGVLIVKVLRIGAEAELFAVRDSCETLVYREEGRMIRFRMDLSGCVRVMGSEACHR